MKKILIIFALLAICTNAIAEELTKEQIEKKFNLPPEPNPEVNNATVLGVDTNNNNIRDDIERLITLKYYENNDRLNLSLKYFELMHDLIISIKLKDHIKYWEIDKKVDLVRECSFYLYNDYIDYDISLMVFNTKERAKIFLEGDKVMSPYKSNMLNYNFTKEYLNLKCSNLNN